MQDETRASLQSQGTSITRPFYVIDLRALDDPIFVYLDEGDDPAVYQATPGYSNRPEISKSWNSLKAFIDSGVQSIIDGESPF